MEQESESLQDDEAHPPTFQCITDMHWGQDLQSFQHKSWLESQLLMNALVLFKEFTCWVFDYLIYHLVI